MNEPKKDELLRAPEVADLDPYNTRGKPKREAAKELLDDEEEEVQPELSIKERLDNEVMLAVASLKVDGLIDMLTEINEKLTGEYLAHFVKDEETKQRFKEELEDFARKAHNGFGQFEVALGDGGWSKIIIEDVDREVSVSISPRSSTEVIAKWEELQ